MVLFRKWLIVMVMLAMPLLVCAQFSGISVSTELNLQRSFKKGQQYWAVGQTVHFQIHVDPKNTYYSWISYFSNGKFNNDLTAVAKSPSGIPQELTYKNAATMRFKHFSLGYKRYLMGSCENDASLNIYGLAGFGLLLGRIENIHSINIDTAQYQVPVRNGKANFKRLTIDLGVGVEIPLGGDIFFYSESKMLVPASDYPSKYLFENNNAPLMGTICAGIRLHFN